MAISLPGDHKQIVRVTEALRSQNVTNPQLTAKLISKLYIVMVLYNKIVRFSISLPRAATPLVRPMTFTSGWYCLPRHFHIDNRRSDTKEHFVLFDNCEFMRIMLAYCYFVYRPSLWKRANGNGYFTIRFSINEYAIDSFHCRFGFHHTHNSFTFIFLFCTVALKPWA